MPDVKVRVQCSEERTGYPTSHCRGSGWYIPSKECSEARFVYMTRLSFTKEVTQCMHIVHLLTISSARLLSANAPQE